ncbi:Extracellular superoxide dismutase [Cu-Zn] [Clonorchis sinensis]|uniref:Superoxide dismutase [Cu-Zn] n=1 Tax=Clonorchis sinensis TaxID=79923 RepID=A0A3R7GXE8_CLOSI|nr:Extracellular superoxide dismutase [Cu-Zn] [Clonorchis sinensis]
MLPLTPRGINSFWVLIFLTPFTTVEPCIRSKNLVEHAETVATFHEPYSGQVHFTPLSTGELKVTGSVSGLPPNKTLGIHVHETGDLGNHCKNAGGHWNPFNKWHGGLTSSVRHEGDLGNVKTDAQGVMSIDLITLPDEDDPTRGYVGLALVINDGQDDLGLGGNERSRIDGNSGERLACSVIGRRQSLWIRQTPIQKVTTPAAGEK